MTKDRWLTSYRMSRSLKNLAKGNPLFNMPELSPMSTSGRQALKLVSLLTNDMEMEPKDIVDIYRERWEIVLLFKQLKQNFTLRYFYGENANAFKIQIWVTLIANLLFMVIKKRIKNKS